MPRMDTDEKAIINFKPQDYTDFHKIFLFSGVNLVESRGFIINFFSSKQHP